MQLKDKFEKRRGSALLIVLGMLSFMIVSAVGFSIFMRQSRQPSSFLRRNVTARYLVKAALANAIEEIDCGFMSNYEIGIDDEKDRGYVCGIHNDLYPSSGSASDRDKMKKGDRKINGRELWYCENGNLWFHRVFCPFGPLYYPTDDSPSEDDQPLTVPTLTMEALAYLPAAIADDVRMASRMTRTAMWKSLPYESGRYAYTAVNVSDFFDINRLRASYPRNSGPDKISLAPLTSQSAADPTQIDINEAENLDKLIDFEDDGSVNTAPFVSLADFAVYASCYAEGLTYSPFSQYVGQTAGRLLGGRGVDAKVANSLFVTDSWFPPATSSAGANGGGTANAAAGGGDSVVYNLTGAHQPFKSFNATSFLTVLGEMNQQDRVDKLLVDNLGIGVCCLYDYLDGNSIPISLCLPTTEPVPMVIGINAPVGLAPLFGALKIPPSSFKVTGLPGTVSKSDGTTVNVSDIEIDRTVQPHGIQFLGKSIKLTVLAAYPFKRMTTARRTGSYTLRGLMRIYLGTASMGCRPADVNGLLHPVQNLWTATTPGVQDGVATFVSDNPGVTDFSADVLTTEQAISNPITLTFSTLPDDIPLYYEIKEDPSTARSPSQPGSAIPDPGTFSPSYQSISGMLRDNAVGSTVMRPFDSNGNVVNDWVNEASKAINSTAKYGVAGGYAELTATTVPGQYRLYASVWIQVLDGSQVVDMVPACIQDDVDWLNSSVSPTDTKATKLFGDGSPILTFMSSADFSYDAAGLQAQTAPTFAWESLYAVDPRFNAAPEDWFSTTDAAFDKDQWKTYLGISGGQSPLFGKPDGVNNGRDTDIFMFVSNQEYLQSVGELQFLPSLHPDFDGKASFPDGDLPVMDDPSATYYGKPLSYRTPADLDISKANTDLENNLKFAHGNLFWRTYSAFGTDEPMREEMLKNEDGSAVSINPSPYHLKKSGAGLTGQDASVVSGAGGFRVNPLSEDNRIMAAAIVGTPFDYYVASTNFNQRQQGSKKNEIVETMTLQDMINYFSFGNGTAAKMSNTELVNIMDEIREQYRASGKSFDLFWNSLYWQDTTDPEQLHDQNKNFLATDMDMSTPLHGVDRKYLYSFWRECFANRQQLFLVFVRAEPATIGGGAAGTVSSAQLGGRAVALVWRDPEPPNGNSISRQAIDRAGFHRNREKDCPPHRTRILFYHQFD